MLHKSLFIIIGTIIFSSCGKRNLENDEAMSTPSRKNEDVMHDMKSSSDKKGVTSPVNDSGMGYSTEEAFKNYPDLSKPEVWLRKKYGIASGTIIYDILDYDVMRLNVHFTDNGEREVSHYFFEEGGSLYMSSLMTMEGMTHRNLDPLDENLLTYRTSFMKWSPQNFIHGWNYPNFSNLTPEQVDCFDIEMHETRTYLDREVQIYRMTDTRYMQTTWEFWVWNGIVLYKRMDAQVPLESGPVERTIIWKAISIDESEPPSDVFNLHD